MRIITELKDLASLLRPWVHCWHCLCRDVNQPWFWTWTCPLSRCTCVLKLGRWRDIDIHSIPNECLAAPIAVSLFCPTLSKCIQTNFVNKHLVVCGHYWREPKIQLWEMPSFGIELMSLANCPISERTYTKLNKNQGWFTSRHLDNVNN